MISNRIIGVDSNGFGKIRNRLNIIPLLGISRAAVIIGHYIIRFYFNSFSKVFDGFGQIALLGFLVPRLYKTPAKSFSP